MKNKDLTKKKNKPDNKFRLSNILINFINKNKLNLLTSVYDFLQYVFFQVIIIGFFLGFKSIWPYEKVLETQNQINYHLMQFQEYPAINDSIRSTLDSNISLIKDFYFKFYLIIIVSLILIIIISNIFRCVVYLKLKKEKLTPHLFSKFALFNSPWMLIWVGIFLISYLFLDVFVLQVLLPLEIFIYLCWSVIYRSLCFEGGSIKNTIKIFFRISIMNLHKYIKTIFKILLLFTGLALIMGVVFPVILKLLSMVFPQVFELFFALILFILGLILVFFTVSYSRKMLYTNVIEVKNQVNEK